MRTQLSTLCATLLLAAGPGQVVAQSLRVAGRVVVAGSDVGVPRILACANRLSPPVWHCAESDSLGRFSLESVPRDGEVVFRCWRIRGLPKEVAGSLAGSAAPQTALRVEVDSVGCDLRPLRRVAGVFAGHWSRGFEQANFTPCASESWYVFSDTAGVDDYARSAWFNLPAGDQTPGAPVVWPRARLVHPPWNYPEHFVRWRGTVVGPGRYGHMGVSGFEAEVDSLLEVRTPANTDCVPRQARPNGSW